MWPDLGSIKNIPFVIVGISNWHHLDKEIPNWEIFFLNVLIKVLDSIVSFLLHGIFRLEGTCPLLWNEVVFDPKTFIISIYPFESMNSVAIHLAEISWNTSTWEQHHQGLNGFRIQRHEVPESVGILQIWYWIFIHSMDHVR